MSVQQQGLQRNIVYESYVQRSALCSHTISMSRVLDGLHRMLDRLKEAAEITGVCSASSFMIALRVFGVAVAVWMQRVLGHAMAQRHGSTRQHVSKPTSARSYFEPSHVHVPARICSSPGLQMARQKRPGAAWPGGGMRGGSRDLWMSRHNLMIPA
jgi:hypothetical protein